MILVDIKDLAVENLLSEIKVVDRKKISLTVIYQNKSLFCRIVNTSPKSDKQDFKTSKKRVKFEKRGFILYIYKKGFSFAAASVQPDESGLPTRFFPFAAPDSLLFQSEAACYGKYHCQRGHYGQDGAVGQCGCFCRNPVGRESAYGQYGGFEDVDEHKFVFSHLFF